MTRAPTAFPADYADWLPWFHIVTLSAKVEGRRKRVGVSW